jgi:putative PIN family toxin of toxin-antitoxin system
MTPAEGGRALVLDTNVALDLLLFEDPGTAVLREALQQRRLRWLVSPAMRAEFVRVLDYPQLAAWRSAHGRSAQALCAAFDAWSHVVDAAPACAVPCADPDDQPFIDLAVAHRAVLLSKDQAVLAPRARLAALGVDVSQQLVTNSVPSPA